MTSWVVAPEETSFLPYFQRKGVSWKNGVAEISKDNKSCLICCMTSYTVQRQGFPYYIHSTLLLKSIPWYHRTILVVWCVLFTSLVTGTFQEILVHGKNAAMHLSTKYVLKAIKSFQMRYFMKFYVNKHQKYHLTLGISDDT